MTCLCASLDACRDTTRKMKYNLSKFLIKYKIDFDWDLNAV